MRVDTQPAPAEPSQAGYVHKYRANLHGFLVSQWQLRYLVVAGNQALVYKCEADTSVAPPRQVIKLQGCRIVKEGVRKDRFWPICVLDASDRIHLRISLEGCVAAEVWFEALVTAAIGLGKPASSMGSGRTTPRGIPRGSSMQHVSSAASISHMSDCSEASCDFAGTWHPLTTSTGDAFEALAPAGRYSSGPAACGGPVTMRKRPSLSTLAESHEHGPRTSLDASSLEASAASPTRSGPSGNELAGRPEGLKPPATGPTGPSGSLSAHNISPSAPLHINPRFSLLSSERIAHQQHAGLINLGMVIILAANSRLILENILKYGLRADPLRWLQRAIGSRASSSRLTLLSFLMLMLVITLAWVVEATGVLLLRRELALRTESTKSEGAKRGAARAAGRAPRVTESVVLFLQAIVSVILPIAVPLAACWLSDADPIPSSMLCMAALTVWMKLISYAQCNADYRSARRSSVLRVGERGTVIPTKDDRHSAPAIVPTVLYPENITLVNLLYFIAVPTLCYQMEYPRTARVRTRWLARRVLELLCFGGLMLFLVDQYVEPAILNSLVPLRQSNLLQVLERLLKLSLPCMYVWLVLFYLFFHLYLNVLAEVTRFADREFYKDWWNATTIGDYWRLWNMPVHKWMMRTIYSPLVRQGWSKTVSGLLVFTVSAAMHEFAIACPLRMLCWWAFIGMMAQIPMMHLTAFLKAKFKNDQFGNIIFWVTFCVIGQPMCALLYYYAYLSRTSPDLLHGVNHLSKDPKCLPAQSEALSSAFMAAVVT